MTKSGKYFQFKQFDVHHDRCTMKVGTDGVLLGTWVNIRNATRILDIGTGSGVIALILAQRSAAETGIDAVEVEEQDATQAMENALGSPWPKKIKIHHTSIQQFTTRKKYDLIVSNPPYFINSQQPPDAKRIQARHTVTLNHTDLLRAVTNYLHPSGAFNIVLPFTEGLQFIDLARTFALHCSRQWSFRTRNEKPIERWLLEFSSEVKTMETGEILLYDRDTNWSESYRNLTRDFYLKA
ncbi:MAG TPA: methyltransferase [Ohtaekwangia sp.]